MRDTLAVCGLGLVAVGFWAIWPATAFIVVGALLLAGAVVGVLAPHKS